MHFEQRNNQIKSVLLILGQPVQYYNITIQAEAELEQAKAKLELGTFNFTVWWTL